MHETAVTAFIISTSCRFDATTSTSSMDLTTDSLQASSAFGKSFPFLSITLIRVLTL